MVVSPTSGLPVSGLQLEDFTLLDNNVPRTITSFEAIDRRQAQVEVVLVIDAVNVEARELAIEREEIKRFLKTDKGRLAYPTTFAVLTETGIRLHLGSSRDGKAISNALDHSRIPKRSTGRDTDRGATAASFESSFEGFAQLVAEERERSGRKLIVWLSPRWPMHSDPQISKQLRDGQITLYMVDPSGTADLEPGLEDIPVNHTRPADTATQSGGLALHPGNDMASAMRRCVADARAYYEISFNPATADRPNEYHQLEVHVAKPGLTARTRQGYYSQPPRAEKFTAGSEQPGEAGGDNNPPGAAPADVSGGLQFTPTAHTSFKSTDHLIAYFELYEPLLTEQPKTQVQARVKLVDAQSGETRFQFAPIAATSLERRGSATLAVTADLPLAQLPKGNYIVEAQATDSAGSTSPMRTATFTIQ